MSTEAASNSIVSKASLIFENEFIVSPLLKTIYTVNSSERQMLILSKKSVQLSNLFWRLQKHREHSYRQMPLFRSFYFDGFRQKLRISVFLKKMRNLIISCWFFVDDELKKMILLVIIVIRIFFFENWNEIDDIANFCSSSDFRNFWRKQDQARDDFLWLHKFSAHLSILA